jgi:hypothetical protein
MTSLKFWDGFQWIEIGSVPGPQGIQGIQGPQGVVGPAGPSTLETWVGPNAPSPRGDYTVWVDTDDPDPTVEAWHLIGGSGEPAFGASWSSYSVPAFMAAGFFKDLSGIVHLKGLVKKAVAIVTPDTIFTLPAGYRPLASALLFPTISNSALGRIDIQTTGAVQVNMGNAGWVALDGISFRGEA